MCVCCGRYPAQPGASGGWRAPMRLGIAEDPIAQTTAGPSPNERENSNAFGQPHRLIAPAPLVSRSSNHTGDPGRNLHDKNALGDWGIDLRSDIDCALPSSRYPASEQATTTLPPPIHGFYLPWQLRSFSSASEASRCSPERAVGHPKRVRPLDLHWENLSRGVGATPPRRIACPEPAAPAQLPTSALTPLL